jgi:hypothetical protein
VVAPHPRRHPNRELFSRPTLSIYCLLSWRKAQTLETLRDGRDLPCLPRN